MKRELVNPHPIIERMETLANNWGEDTPEGRTWKAAALFVADAPIEEVVRCRACLNRMDGLRVDARRNDHRGEWVLTKKQGADWYSLRNYWECSKCGYSFEDKSKAPRPPKMKFCPNCGKPMRVEV